MRIIARAAEEASDEIYASSAEKSSKSVADCDADCAVDCLHRITRKWQWQRGSGGSDGGNGSICHANCVRDKSCQLNYNVCMQRKTLKRQQQQRQQQRQRRVDGQTRRLQNDLCDYRVFYHLSGSRLRGKGGCLLPYN